MEETTVLILLAVVMLIGSYLTGSIPLVVNLSEEKLQLVSVLGAGMLVGTALSVIIPEGVRSLISKSHVVTPTKKDDGTINVLLHHHEDKDIHGIIGMSLVLGFLFMLLIDQISSSRSKGDIENAIKGSSHGATATIGLVVHSAADGVALGAAASTAHHDIEIIIFLAIMLHKAPAAFGLVTFLLHEGLERVRIRKHLLVFSLAAPVMALLTYFGLGQEGKETLSSFNATGTAMLFSAGTFLYVATVHVLPELMVRRSNHSIGANSHAGHVLGKSELIAIVVGALLPSLLTMGHHH
ncbi:hypothetical protein RUM44_008424 [Polyplax serrata]|uniref:Zinc transporter ZIP9 n=1 Tax=Polyplax serrata TaxID=468196 RepID=A0ABR1B887_POLSC